MAFKFNQLTGKFDLVGGGSLTLAAFGATPNANGLTITGSTLNMEPADATHPGGVSIGTQTFAGEKTVTSLFTHLQTASAANTVNYGLHLNNTTTASAGNQMYSPASRKTGQGWKTNATAASQSVEYREQVIPVQGAAAPTARHDWDYAVNGGAFTNLMSLTSAGFLGLSNTTPHSQVTVTGTSAATCRLGFAFSNTYGQTYFSAGFSSGAQNSNTLTGYINQIGGTGTQWMAVQGNLQLTLAGALVVTGQTLGQNGTAGLPAFSFSSDSDNGMYRISANTLGFAVAGGERIRLASTGFNGVSMTNPKVRWHVANNTAGGTHNAAIICNNTNAGTGGVGTGPYTGIDFSHLNDQASDIQRKAAIGFEKITTFSRGDLVFSICGTADDTNVNYLNDEKMRLTMAGNLGIGLSTVTAYLHIKAGTATANTAPLKLTSGTNLTTAENGAFEYDGTNLFFTRTGAVRENIICASAVTTEIVVSDTTLTINYNGVTYKLLAVA